MLRFGVQVLDHHQGPQYPQKALLEASYSGKYKLARSSGRKIIAFNTPQPYGVIIAMLCAVKSLCQLIKYNNLFFYPFNRGQSHGPEGLSPNG